MKKTIMLFGLFVLTTGVFAQSSKEIETLNKKIQNIPYVFQGEIIDVEIYPGDKEGNRIPNEEAVWDSGAGEFYQSDGSYAIGYSSAKFKVCKVINCI